MRRGWSDEEESRVAKAPLPKVAAAELDREWHEFVTGQPLPPGRSVPEKVSERTYTERTIKRLGEQGLKRILYTARNGDPKDALRAAIYLVDRCMGAPDKPFSERVLEMTPEEAERELLDTYIEMGVGAKLAREMVEAFKKNA